MTCRNWIRSARTRGRSSASSTRLNTPRSLRSPCTRVITSRGDPFVKRGPGKGLLIIGDAMVIADKTTYKDHLF